MYSIPFRCGKVYKDGTCRWLKVTLEEHRKAIRPGEDEKSGMTDFGLKNWHPSWINEGFSSRLCVNYRIRHETPEEGRKAYWLKSSDYNKEEEVISLNILSDKTKKLSTETLPENSKYEGTCRWIGIRIAIGALRTISKIFPKGLEELEIGGQAETIKTLA